MQTSLLGLTARVIPVRVAVRECLPPLVELRLVPPVLDRCRCGDFYPPKRPPSTTPSQGAAGPVPDHHAENAAPVSSIAWTSGCRYRLVTDRVLVAATRWKIQIGC